MFNPVYMKEENVERNLQLEFDEILRNVIFPFFKEHGFKRNGNGFNRKTKELIQVVNVQKSQWNHQDNISFTLNIGFLDAEMYVEDWSKEIPKFVREYNCQIRFRLGQIAKGNDYWYQLDKSIEKANLEIEIYTDLKTHLKPILEKYTELNSIKDFILNDNKLGWVVAEFQKIKILLKIGEKEKAQELLGKEYLNALNPEDYVSKTTYPDGTVEIKTSKSKVNFEYIENLKAVAKKYNVILQ